MFAQFLIPETTATKDGNGPAVALGEHQGTLLRLTLGVTRIVEQESLDISIHGSADGSAWSAKPIVSFPQKFYCGTYVIVADLSQNPDVRYVRVQWKMNRWGRGSTAPMFGFYVFAEEAAQEALATAAC